MLKNMPIFYAKKKEKKREIIVQNYYFHIFQYCIILETYINLPSMDFLI